MKLTVVTAVFNAVGSGNQDRLVQCVESVAKLKTPHEHLIYDGASKDGTVELLRKLESETPGLKVVSEPDTGIYNALNKGVRDAEGEWLYVLGCDDHVCDPAAVDDLLSDRLDDVDVLAAAVRIEEPDGRIVGIFAPRMNAIYTIPCACHQAEFIRVDLARELGGFDEQYRFAADSDMFFKAHVKGYRFRYSNHVIAVFVDGGTSDNNVEASQREHRTSVANVLNLSRKDRELLIEDHVLSLRTCFNLSKHSDIVMRQAAKTMARRRLKKIVRTLFYPLVVAVRPIRTSLRNR